MNKASQELNHISVARNPTCAPANYALPSMEIGGKLRISFPEAPNYNVIDRDQL